MLSDRAPHLSLNTRHINMRAHQSRCLTDRFTMKRRSQTLAAGSDVVSVALGGNMSEPAVSEESARSECVVEVVARARPRSTRAPSC